MFQSSSQRLRAWLSRFDDVLDDVLGDRPADANADLHTWHPHRRPLRWRRERRGGSVPSAPAHCVSPIRRPRDLSGRDEAIR
jgi:hypothetical protein